MELGVTVSILDMLQIAMFHFLCVLLSSVLIFNPCGRLLLGIVQYSFCSDFKRGTDMTDVYVSSLDRRNMTCESAFMSPW